MRHWLSVGQSWYVRYRGVRSNVHEHALTSDDSFASVAQGDLESTRPDEAGIAADQFRSRVMVLIEMSLDQVIDHLFLARVDPGHVDGDRPSFHPEFVVAPEQRRHLRAMNDVFGRQAGDVWTRSAHILSFHY